MDFAESVLTEGCVKKIYGSSFILFKLPVCCVLWCCAKEFFYYVDSGCIRPEIPTGKTAELPKVAANSSVPEDSNEARAEDPWKDLCAIVKKSVLGLDVPAPQHTASKNVIRGCISTITLTKDDHKSHIPKIIKPYLQPSTPPHEKLAKKEDHTKSYIPRIVKSDFQPSSIPKDRLAARKDVPEKSYKAGGQDPWKDLCAIVKKSVLGLGVPSPHDAEFRKAIRGCIHSITPAKDHLKSRIPRIVKPAFQPSTIPQERPAREDDHLKSKIPRIVKSSFQLSTIPQEKPARKDDHLKSQIPRRAKPAFPLSTILQEKPAREDSHIGNAAEIPKVAPKSLIPQKKCKEDGLDPWKELHAIIKKNILGVPVPIPQHRDFRKIVKGWIGSPSPTKDYLKSQIPRAEKPQCQLSTPPGERFARQQAVIRIIERTQGDIFSTPKSHPFITSSCPPEELSCAEKWNIPRNRLRKLRSEKHEQMDLNKKNPAAERISIPASSSFSHNDASN